MRSGDIRSGDIRSGDIRNTDIISAYIELRDFSGPNIRIIALLQHMPLMNTTIQFLAAGSLHCSHASHSLDH